MSGSSPTDQHGMKVTVAANVAGIVSLSGEKTIMPGRMIAAARYNRALGDLIRRYGEFESLKIDFFHGRDMYDWEIGMFLEMAGRIQTLSIVARHILQASYVETSGVPITDYQHVADEFVGLSPFYDTQIVPHLDEREHQVHIVFRDICSVAHARIAAEYAVRQGRKASGLCHHASRSYGLRWNIVDQPERKVELVERVLEEVNVPYVQVDSMGWAAGNFQSSHAAEQEKQRFLKALSEYTGKQTDPVKIPSGYYQAVLTELVEDVITGDLENDLRIREYLRSEGTNVRVDSSSLVQNNDICSSLDVALEHWKTCKHKRRRADGKRRKPSTACYNFLRQKLLDHEPRDHFEQVYGALWTRTEQRRSELDILGAQNPLRRTMGSIERVFVEHIFDLAAKKELGWINRRKQFELVETRTEFYVVLPVERCVSVWTKRSLHNSFEAPWRPHVQSETTLEALSAVCLFSGCVYPDGNNAGQANIDRELFADNVRNASRGIGYALKLLEDEHRESLLREAASWYRHPLKISSLESLIWKELHWLDNGSKAWVTRETITLLHHAGVNVYVDRMEGGFANAMYSVNNTPRLPVLLVDCPVPAGGVLLFSCKMANQETARAIATRLGTDSDSLWSYRELQRVENHLHVGRELRGTMHRIGVEFGTSVYD